MGRFLRVAVVSGTTAVWAVALSLASSAQTVQAASPPGTTSVQVAATGPTSVSTTQTALLAGSTASFPTSAPHGTGGAVNLTEAGQLQRWANISKSPRPAVVRTASGGSTLAARDAVSWLPVVTPTPVSRTRPGVVTGWNGLDEFDNQKFAGFSVEPPDQGLCAANGHVLELINDTAAVYSTSGTRETVASLNDFFKEPTRQFLTDPSCVYDAGSNRFFAVELTLDVDPATGNLTGRNYLDLAVSRTGDPTGGWRIYRLEVADDGTRGTPSHPGCPCIGDYPHLATDAHGVFLTTNEYPFGDDPGLFGNNFNGAQVYALSKTAVAAGSSSVAVVHFEQTRLPEAAGPVHPGFTLWPAQSAGTAYATQAGGTVYFVSSGAAEEARPQDFTGHGNELGLWWISNTASLDTRPALTLQAKILTVGDYGIPPLSNQKPGPVPLRDCLQTGCLGTADPYAPEDEGGLDSSDSRVLTAVYAAGQVHAALDTSMSVAGNLKAGVEWFSVSASRAASTLAGQGYLGVAGQNVTYPAVVTDTAGRGYVGMTLAGNSFFPSAAYTSWDTGVGPQVHVAFAGAAPEDGFCEYLFFNCGGTVPTASIRPRWGDYGAAAWDGSTFFLANEDVAHGCSFTVFQSDPTCGGTRSAFSNFATRITALR